LNIDALKTSILNYVSHFTMYDYVAYAWLILTFFIAILLSILLAKKSMLFSMITLVFSLTLLVVGPFILKSVLDNFLRPTVAIVKDQKKLTFSDVLIINVELTNLSKKDYSICFVDTSVVKYSNSSITSFFNTLKPLRKKSISLDTPIKAGQKEEFNVVFYNYDYEGDINASVKSECY
jgi:hypothetical protein